MTLDSWLDACADHPDDDLRRFAFADWLDEHGDADRAEFIRLQVALSRLPQEQREPAQQHRAEALLTRHRTAWLGPLVNLAAAHRWRFPRGVPEQLMLSGKRLGEAGVARLVVSPHLARITELDLPGNQIGDAGVQALAGAPYLARLTTLSLGSNRIGEAGAQALADSPHLARLTYLDLRGNPLGDAGTQALRQAFDDRFAF
jgi:uncharacterized protein (TIGR02996 family)